MRWCPSYLIIIIILFDIIKGDEPPLPWAQSNGKKKCCGLNDKYPMIPRFPRQNYKYIPPKPDTGNNFAILNLKRRELKQIKTKHFFVTWNPVATTKSDKEGFNKGMKFPWNTKFVIRGPRCPEYHKQPCCKKNIPRQQCCRPCKQKMPKPAHHTVGMGKPHFSPIKTKKTTCGTYFQNGYICQHPLRPASDLTSACDQGRGRRPCKNVCCKSAPFEVRIFKCYKWFQMGKKCSKHKVKHKRSMLKACNKSGGKNSCKKLCCRKRHNTCKVWFKYGNKCLRGTTRARRVRHIQCLLSGKGKKSCRNLCCRIKKKYKKNNLSKLKRKAKRDAKKAARKAAKKHRGRRGRGRRGKRGRKKPRRR